MPRIHSIIEIFEDDNRMETRKKKHKKESVDLPEIQPSYRSEAMSDKNRFFHGVKRGDRSVKQKVNVQVTVNEPQDDCVTSCFSGLAKCFAK